MLERAHNIKLFRSIRTAASFASIILVIGHFSTSDPSAYIHSPQSSLFGSLSIVTTLPPSTTQSPVDSSMYFQTSPLLSWLYALRSILWSWSSTRNSRPSSTSFWSTPNRISVLSLSSYLVLNPFDIIWSNKDPKLLWLIIVPKSISGSEAKSSIKLAACPAITALSLSRERINRSWISSSMITPSLMADNISSLTLYDSNISILLIPPVLSLSLNEFWSNKYRPWCDKGSSSNPTSTSRPSSAFDSAKLLLNVKAYWAALQDLLLSIKCSRLITRTSGGERALFLKINSLCVE